MSGTFDYIVLGAGSAGCVLANRLSADPANRVLLVEAGPRDWNPLIRSPMLAGQFFRRRYINWSFETEPQPHLAGRRIMCPRGRVLGGSSSINGMIYARGHPADYDGWAQLGLRSWSWDRVLPDFRRSERFEGGADAFHGGDGLLPVTLPRVKSRLYDAFIAAGREAGHPVSEDFNGAEPEGVGRYHYNIHGGQRWSASRAFLGPARTRANLTVMTEAEVLKVTMERRRAVGAELSVRGRKVAVRAEREVILSAGAIGSPAILMHSGIGDPDSLSALGITPTVERREVGRNLQDHLQVAVSHATDEPDGIYDFRRADRAVTGVLQSIVLGTGPATAFPTLTGGFLRSEPHVEPPDIQLHFIMGLGFTLRWPLGLGKPAVGHDGYAFNGSVCHLRPESRGAVTLKNADPRAAPAIDPNYLAAETDRRAMREGVRQMREIFAQPAFDPYRGRELAPGEAVRSDADIDAWIARAATTIFHPVGTCRMGVDEAAVVDESLRLNGAEGLRVIDASVMPRIVSANTHAATVMIAERGARLILQGETALAEAA